MAGIVQSAMAQAPPPLPLPLPLLRFRFQAGLSLVQSRTRCSDLTNVERAPTRQWSLDGPHGSL